LAGSKQDDVATLDFKLNTIPNPRKRSGGGFVKTSWNIDELKTAVLAGIVHRQTGLVVIGHIARGGLKKGIERKLAHGWPPS
jgi:hypothetical protein